MVYLIFLIASEIFEVVYSQQHPLGKVVEKTKNVDMEEVLYSLFYF
jgi:hypothetical protein